MKLDLLKRLEKLERVHGQDDLPEAIVIRVIDSDGEVLPVLGWQESMTRDPHTVMRRPGESDQELEARAIAEIRARRPKGAVPAIIAIFEGEEDEQA